MPESTTITAYNGEKVTVNPVKRLADGGTRIDMDVEDGPSWRLNVTRSGDPEVLTSRNADGELADVEFPDWGDDVLSRLARV